MLLGSNLRVSAIGVFVTAIFDAAHADHGCAVADFDDFLAITVGDSRCEITHESLGAGQLGIQVHGNGGMLRNPLDQLFQVFLWRDKVILSLRRYSGLHAEIIEAEMHMAQGAAQLAVAFHKIHREALIGQGQGRFHAGSATADDQRAALDRNFTIGQRMQHGSSRRRHADQVLGLARGGVPVMGMHPGALVADVGHIEQVRIQAGRAQAVAEYRLMGQRRTAGDDHAVGAQLSHLLGDSRHAVLGTGIERVFGMNDVGQAFAYSATCGTSR